MTAIDLAAIAWESRRERLLDDADCMRIARDIARGVVIDLSGQPEVTAERSGDRGSAGRVDGTQKRGEVAACPDTFPHRNATGPSSTSGTAA